MNITPDKINVTANTPVGIVLLNAITELLKPNDPRFDAIVAYHREHGHINASMIINGVELPLLEPLQNILDRYMKQMEAEAGKRAFELVSKAGLNKIQEALQQAEWTIKQALRDAGAQIDED